MDQQPVNKSICNRRILGESAVQFRLESVNRIRGLSTDCIYSAEESICLAQGPGLDEQYKALMKEYISMGHMQKVPTLHIEN